MREVQEPGFRVGSWVVDLDRRPPTNIAGIARGGGMVVACVDTLTFAQSEMQSLVAGAFHRVGSDYIAHNTTSMNRIRRPGQTAVGL